VKKRDINFLLFVFYEQDSCGAYTPEKDSRYAGELEELYFKGFLGRNEEGFYLTEKGLEIVNLTIDKSI
jgi:hypothetical protein